MLLRRRRAARCGTGRCSGRRAGAAEAAAPAAAPNERRPSDEFVTKRRGSGEAAVGDFVTATVKGEERTAEVARRDSTGRVRLSLAGGDSIWVQMDAILVGPAARGGGGGQGGGQGGAEGEGRGRSLQPCDGRTADEGLKKET